MFYVLLALCKETQNFRIFFLTDEIKKYFGLQKCLRYSGLLPTLTDEDFLVRITTLIYRNKIQTK